MNRIPNKKLRGILGYAAHIIAPKGAHCMSDISHRLVMLKPMQVGASGYARMQCGAGRTQWQLHARGLTVKGIRAFLYSGGGEAMQLGSATVNPRGEAFVEADTQSARVAPERLQALLVVSDGDEPAPLLIGMCVQQSAGSLLDAKNASLALCEKLSKAAAMRRAQEAQRAEQKEAQTVEGEAGAQAANAARNEATEHVQQSVHAHDKPQSTQANADPPKPTPQSMPAHDNAQSTLATPQSTPAHSKSPSTQPTPQSASAHDKTRAQALNPPPDPPREIFLPAIDPLPYVTAAELQITEPFQPPLPAHPKAPPVSRLPALKWQGAYRRLQMYFDTEMPRALFDMPGWRFVNVSKQPNELWIGRYQIDGHVRRVAYALCANEPPNDGRPYRARRALNGKTYQVLWQRL